jgi:Nucleotidyltransferase of unknown function (DUF6036)
MPDEKILPPEPWHLFLTELDALAPEEVRLECLGGFVVTTLYGMLRPTADVDVFSIKPMQQRNDFLARAGKDSEFHEKHGVYLDFVSVVTLPYSYDERLRVMYPNVYKHLRLFALDPYDLALTKLSRNIARDREDVRYLARTTPFDIAILRGRYMNEFRRFMDGIPENNDANFNMWIAMIEEERGDQHQPS